MAPHEGAARPSESEGGATAATDPPVASAQASGTGGGSAPGDVPPPGLDPPQHSPHPPQEESAPVGDAGVFEESVTGPYRITQLDL